MFSEESCYFKLSDFAESVIVSNEEDEEEEEEEEEEKEGEKK